MKKKCRKLQRVRYKMETVPSCLGLSILWTGRMLVMQCFYSILFGKV